MCKRSFNRRQFLRAAGAGIVAAGASSADAQQREKRMPTREFGNTGVAVSILGMGGGSQFFKALPADPQAAEEKATEMLTAALDGGMTYFDTANAYVRRGRRADGRRVTLYSSEHLYGLVLSKRRDECFVATKVGARDRDGVLRQFEQSLERLGMDRIDLLQLHSINPGDDLRAINGRTGAYQAFRELKEEGLIRFAGISGHSTAPHMRDAIDVLEGLDAALFPVNAARDERDRRGRFREQPDSDIGHFKSLLLPHCIERGIAVISMKATAQGYLIGEGPGRADAQTLIRYAMSVSGVSCTIVGPGSVENLRANLAMAQQFRPMPSDEKRRLTAMLGDVAREFAYAADGYADV
ncbi:MAG: aldo/keto reductase [Armatimonadota bacterium]